jgi:ribosomal protein S18 acetylase RimI-like enzyme
MKAFLGKLLVFHILGLCALFAELRLEFFEGSDILPFAVDLAGMSNILYKEYPYLYGIEDDAEFYITRYCHSKEAKLCLAYDGPKIVGYTIGVPLKNYSLSFQEPFIKNQLDVGRFFYIGEVALFPEYRGQGIGKDMLLQMERLVKQEQSYPEICLAHIDESCVFATPPINYVSLAHVWIKLGYKRKENLFFTPEWPNVGDVHPSTHTLVYWVKRL